MGISYCCILSTLVVTIVNHKVMIVNHPLECKACYLARKSSDRRRTGWAECSAQPPRLLHENMMKPVQFFQWVAMIINSQIRIQAPVFLVVRIYDSE